MKIRNITYGYQIKNGSILPHPEEHRIVEEIFRRYASGESLGALAEDLTARKVEFFPGKACWDKARISRVLHEKKYLGTERYPALLDPSQYQLARAQNASIQKQRNPQDAILAFLRSETFCSECHTNLMRRQVTKMPGYSNWSCYHCRKHWTISDALFKKNAVELLSMITNHPELITVEDPEESKPIAARRILNEFHRELDSGTADEDSLIQMALRCAAETYQEYNSARHISGRLAALLKFTSPPQAFDRSLFERTVSEILIDADGTILWGLKNGKVIKGENIL